MTADLLAMLIEVTSVSAAGKQLKKPIEVPRPNRKSSGVARRESTQQATDAAFKRGIGVLAATSREVSR